MIGEIVDIAVFVFFIMGLVRASKLSDEPLPIIGNISGGNASVGIRKNKVRGNAKAFHFATEKVAHFIIAYLANIASRHTQAGQTMYGVRCGAPRGAYFGKPF